MVERIKIQVQTNSSTLIGSGEGFGALIDSDIVFDDIGLPYIPAKRIKGCLRDSVLEVIEILNIAGIPNPLTDIDTVFGKPGDVEPAKVFFSNLYIREYEENQTWLHYLTKHEKFRTYINRETIQSQFTVIRQMTRIEEDGVAADHTLRTFRLVKKGEFFEGDVHIQGTPESNEPAIQMLYLACLNFRRMGTSRNRGFGEISCKLDTVDREINMPEALCIS